MATTLKGRKVAVLATDGVEHSELVEPLNALRIEGAEVAVVSPHSGKIKTWKEKNWAEEFPVDRILDDVVPEQFDALVLPGGALNPDQLRTNEKAVAFVRGFVEQDKPIAAICHGPWTLIETDAVRGRRVTSWPSLKTDLKNAGAEWVNEEVVVDQGLVTSRHPGDLPAFNKKMIEEFIEGRHPQRESA